MARRSSQRYSRRWLSLLALLIIAYLLYGGYVLASLSLPGLLDGITALRRGQGVFLQDPTAAAQDFSAASRSFEAVSIKMRRAPLGTKFLTPLPPFRWQVRLLKASHALSQAGETASRLAAALPPASEEAQTNVSALLTSSSSRYFSTYTSHTADIATLAIQLQEADRELQGVPSWVLLTKAGQLRDLKARVHQAATALPILDTLSTQLRTAFGASDANPHTFLILFQNDAELRPTGGFPGSFALLTASGGTIRQFQFGENIYTLDKRLPLDRELPPGPLRTITTHWDFQDSPIGTDTLAQGAEQLARYYRMASGEQIEGCIFIDTSVLEDILRLTGPVELPTEQRQLVNAQNVRATLTEEVEQNYFDNPENQIINQPKQVLADLMPILLKKIQDTPGVSGQLSGVIQRAVQRKSVQFWARNAELQTILTDLQPGDIPGREANWIKITNTNIGGQKSSRNIRQDVKITQKAEPLQKRIIQNITITRYHEGDGTWPDGPNRNFMQIYLPLEAQVMDLPSSRGGDSQLPQVQQDQLPADIVNYPLVERAAAWQRISLWASTGVGETTTYQLSYSLPQTVVTENRLEYIKQAGAANEYLAALRFKGPVAGNVVLTK